MTRNQRHPISHGLLVATGVAVLVAAASLIILILDG